MLKMLEEKMIAQEKVYLQKLEREGARGKAFAQLSRQKERDWHKEKRRMMEARRALEKQMDKERGKVQKQQEKDKTRVKELERERQRERELEKDRSLERERDKELDKASTHTHTHT
jgi:hypothetical protein